MQDLETRVWESGWSAFKLELCCLSQRVTFCLAKSGNLSDPT